MSVTFEYVLVPKRDAQRPRQRKPDAKRRRSRLAHDGVPHLLALAHRLVEMFERGQIRDYGEAAARLGCNASRISQITSLVHLAPDIQARVLTGELSVAERHLRMAARSADWEQQRAILQGIQHDQRARNQEVQSPQ